MKSLLKVTVACVLALTLVFAKPFVARAVPPTPAQEAFLDEVAHKTWTYLKTAANNHLPYSWSWASAVPSGGSYANPTEIGLYMLSYIAANELGETDATETAVETELTAVVNQLRSWQSASGSPNAYQNKLFYQAYHILPNPPVVGPGSYDHTVPSIDNAFLAASLVTVREWAKSHNKISLQHKADLILSQMNFMLWYNSTTHRFKLGAANNPLGVGDADYYSNENRLINFIARALGQLSPDEFRASLAALTQNSATYNTITVEKVAYDGSYFTYTAPALFLREVETAYGSGTIEPATQAQIAYAQAQGYDAWGLSDAFDICAFDEPNVPPGTPTYRLQGALPVGMPIPPNVLQQREGLVTPHASALALITSQAGEAAANLMTLSGFSGLYDPVYGFKDSVMADPSDPNAGDVSCRYSALAQAYTLLAIADHKTSFIWNYFYQYADAKGVKQVVAAHNEAYCHKAPDNQVPVVATDDLENDLPFWGVFCDNSIPHWEMTSASTLTPSGDNLALRCSITGGDAYSKLHCYRNLPSEANATMFSGDFRFKFSPSTCNNKNGTPSSVQALEFTFSKWLGGKRYEFALQWNNVVDGSNDETRSEWRYWNGFAWVSFSTPIRQCLLGDLSNSAANWHSLHLEGVIVNGNVEYRSFTINAVEHILNITVPSVTDNQADHLAIALQLDSNAFATPYDVLLDDIIFARWQGSLTALTPPDKTNTSVTQPAFSWTPVTAATAYQLALSTAYPPAAIAQQTAALNYTRCQPLSDGVWFWRVRALDAAGHLSPWTRIRQLTVKTPLTAAPPRNYFTTFTPTLTWNRVLWAADYEVQVDTDNRFLPPLSDSAVVSSNLYSVTTTTLPRCGIYYWHVRARNGSVLGAWSTAGSFMVNAP